MTDSSADTTTGSSPLTRPPLVEHVLNEVHEIVTAAQSETKPLEIDPYRGQLFELFVTAEGAGYLVDDSETDLTADGLCQLLANRWGLKQAAEQSYTQQSNLPESQLQMMRSLWSIMRMWMEWTYAWNRWPEFHREDSPS